MSWPVTIDAETSAGLEPCERCGHVQDVEQSQFTMTRKRVERDDARRYVDVRISMVRRNSRPLL